jgi:hypothetical protein
MTDRGWDGVRGWRATRSHLEERAPRSRLLEVVSDVCGLHAQVASAAELQAWARVEDVTPDDVREALWEARTLVRSWFMRGTLHLLPAAEVPLYVGALRTVDRWWKGAWLRFVDLSEEELREVLEAIRASLGARPVTRERLAEKVGDRIGSHARERLMSSWGELLKPAAFHGYLCSGPPRGQQVTFVRPDRWLGEWEDHEPDRAIQEVLRRYLHTYGPATREGFARWWGEQPAPAGRVMRGIADELEEVDVAGWTASALGSDLDGLRGAGRPRAVRLLPGFDPYVVGFRPREELVDPEVEDRVFRKAGWITPTLIVDGRVAGVWGSERAGDRIEVTVEALGRLSAPTRKAVAGEADRLGAFLGARTSLSFGPIG